MHLSSDFATSIQNNLIIGFHRQTKKNYCFKRKKNRIFTAAVAVAVGIFFGKNLFVLIPLSKFIRKSIFREHTITITNKEIYSNDCDISLYKIIK